MSAIKDDIAVLNNEMISSELELNQKKKDLKLALLEKQVSDYQAALAEKNAYIALLEQQTDEDTDTTIAIEERLAKCQASQAKKDAEIQALQEQLKKEKADKQVLEEQLAVWIKAASDGCVRIHTRADPGCSLTVRNGQVTLAPYNIKDPHQYWIQDVKYGEGKKDSWGFIAFALVNRATGQAIKHPVEARKPVQLVPHNANVLDRSLLWSQAAEISEGYKAIRMTSNVLLNLDAGRDGAICDGNTVAVSNWLNDGHQHWKVVPC